LGGGFCSRNRSGRRQPHFRSDVHHESAGHGHGAFDLPIHYRSSSRPVLGLARQDRLDIPVRPAYGLTGTIAMDGMSADNPIVYVVDDGTDVREGLRMLFDSV